MADHRVSNEEAATMYFREVLNLLQKANEPLRLSIMLLSMAATLGEEIPPVIRQALTSNKELCDRMHFICTPATKKDKLN